jgi:hypothetical protein
MHKLGRHAVGEEEYGRQHKDKAIARCLAHTVEPSGAGILRANLFYVSQSHAIVNSSGAKSYRPMPVPLTPLAVRSATPAGFRRNRWLEGIGIAGCFHVIAHLDGRLA